MEYDNKINKIRKGIIKISYFPSKEKGGGG